MATILVPKPPKKAYNPDRRAGTLLKNQLAHLEWAVRPAGKRKPDMIHKIKPPKTEAEAARRIAALTRTLIGQAKARKKAERARVRRRGRRKKGR